MATSRFPNLGPRVHTILADAGPEPLSTLEIAARLGLDNGWAIHLIWRELDLLARHGHVQRITRRYAQCRYWTRILPEPVDALPTPAPIGPESRGAQRAAS